MKRDHAIDALLDLHGSIIDQGSGYWVKFEAWKVDASAQIPHGIRYSLTLHEPLGKRILGYDNAHGTRMPGKFKYAGRILPHDHKHRHVSDKGVHYEFNPHIAPVLVARLFRGASWLAFATEERAGIVDTMSSTPTE